MKPVLFSALLLILCTTGAQATPAPATVFEHWDHIDDGIFAGPKTRVPQVPSVFEELRRSFASRSSGNQGTLDFSVLGVIKRQPLPRTPTLTESQRANRATWKETGLKFVAIREVPVSRPQTPFLGRLLFISPPPIPFMAPSSIISSPRRQISFPIPTSFVVSPPRLHIFSSPYHPSALSPFPALTFKKQVAPVGRPWDQTKLRNGGGVLGFWAH